MPPWNDMTRVLRIGSDPGVLGQAEGTPIVTSFGVAPRFVRSVPWSPAARWQG